MVVNSAWSHKKYKKIEIRVDLLLNQIAELILNCRKRGLISLPSLTPVKSSAVSGLMPCMPIMHSGSVFRYSMDCMEDRNCSFEIDPVKGTISTTKALDREQTTEYNISIVATKVSKYESKCAIEPHNSLSVAVASTTNPF